MMIKNDELSIEEADAIEFVFKAIQSGLDSEIIYLNSEKIVRTDEEISYAEHRATDAMPSVVVRPVRPKLAPEARGRSVERNF